MEMMEQIKKEITQVLKKTDLLKQEKIEETLETPPQEDFGDLASNICFSLSKKLKKSPQEISKQIVSEIKIPKGSIIKKIESKAGYINFFFSYEKIAEKLLKTILKEKEKYGSSVTKENKKVIVEFPSINPGKPWHIGHARNAILGDSVQRILRFSGFNIEVQDYIDDLGLQVAQVLWGILHFPKDELPKKEGLLKKEDQWQGRIYVKVANLFKDNPKVEKEVRNIMKKMEEFDPRIKDVHKRIVDDCLRAQYETDFKLGIYHDLKIHESDIVHSGLFKKAIGKVKKSGKVIEETSGPNKGCLVAKLEELEEFKGMKSPDKILIRSDGTSTYTGKDVAFQMWKFGLVEDPMKYKLWMVQPNGQRVWTTSHDGKPSKKFAYADMVINVIGSEQKYPQKVVYSILRLMGYEKEFKNSIHLAYEHVWFKEKKAPKQLSGREGTWIGYSADEVLNKATGMALKEVNNRNKGLSKSENENISEQIGVGAVRYAMLSTDWEKQVAFDYDEVLSFEGDTGPYLQYAHVRADKILQKAGKWNENYFYEKLTNEEKQLIKKLLEFPETVERTAKHLKPHYICVYAHELAETFSTFYHSCPVIHSKGNLRNFRLTLVKTVKITLKNCLNLLGINTPEIM